MAKYPKTTGYWVYVHRTPDNMCYVGQSKQQICNIWNPSNYRNISLGPYIDQYGWDNIEHLAVKDGLTKEQALYWEERFIQMYTQMGCCINNNRSGNCTADIQTYRRQYSQCPEVKEHIREYNNRPEVKEHKREYHKEYSQRPEVKEYIREYWQNRSEIVNERHRIRYKTNESVKEYHKMKNEEIRSTKSGKIYNRVNAYNQAHPDRKLITPAEAKEMYELTGYIPDFIKKDDLI